MRKLITILLLFFAVSSYGQGIYELKFDSVIVGKSTSSSFWSKGRVWLRGLTVGTNTDSVVTIRGGKLFKEPRSAFGGTGVTNVSSSNGDISVTNPSTTPILLLNASSSTGANKVMRRDGSGDVAITANLYFQSASNRIQSDTYDMYFKTGTSGTGDFYWKSNSDATQAMKLDYLGNLTVLNGMTLGNTLVGGAGATFVGSVSVADEAYDATTWNGNLTVPTKNAVRDKIETISSSSASFTPTVTPSTNISSASSYIFHYTRIGNVVTVYGSLTFTASATSTPSTIILSPPVSTSTTNFIGYGSGQNVSNVWMDTVGTTSIGLNFTTGSSISGQVILFSYSYIVI